MKRTIAIAAALLFSVASAAFAELHGSWTANSWDKKPEVLQLNITRGHNHQFGNSTKVSDLRGLTEAQVNGTAATPVQFQMAREAGTISFEGSFRNGDGAGQWTFTPNRGYVSTIRSMGLEFDLDGGDEEEDLMQLTVLDVSTAYIRSMQAAGYRETLEKYMTMRIFKVTPELVNELRQLGFDHLSADEIVNTRIHKVTPDYIRQMRAAGWNLSLEDLMSSRIHKATPEFAEEMKKLGYSLDFDDLINFRIHRVTAEFINELRDLGYTNLSADTLVEMRIFKVTPEYIRELKSAGYSGIPVRKLIDMKIHKIDIKRLR
ncbi:MAG TPA: hypothetical protein VKB93_27760 [Thermoanaerobaculia bacterium]|nr:hypothetical protein [Thermoanaerobaculia bacterium]